MMKHYRALIVDDEIAARELLRKMICWEEVNFDPPVLAFNGAEALHLLGTQDFDIVFTDVEMPIMDGISFIEKARSFKPNQRFVIISCNEKFEYAQRALRLGVADYMIKDLMTKNELRSLLSSVTPATSGPASERYEESLSKLLESAAKGAELEHDKLPYKHAAVYAIIPDEIERLKFDRGVDKADSLVASFSRQLSCCAVWNTGDDMIYALCQAPDTASTLYFINDAISRAGTIRAQARGLRLGTVSIGVSNPLSSMDRLTAACREAEEAVGIRVTEGFNKTILYNCISMKKQLVDQQYVDHMLSRVEELASNSNPACLRYVDRLYNTELSSGFADANYYRYLNVRLWSLLIALAKAKCFSKFEIISEMGLDLEEINRMENSSMMSQFFKTVLMKIMTAVTPESGENIVSSALAIIEQEYTNDISLNRLAEMLHTHKSYLCRVFKEQMGENLMPYIENKRIERAKYLLQNSQMKLWEISDSLGFASQQYFSYVFKKSTGLSPSDFRKQSSHDII